MVMQPQGRKQLKGRSSGIEVFSVEDLMLSVHATPVQMIEQAAGQVA